MQILVTIITFCLMWNVRCLPSCELCKLEPIGPDMGPCDVHTYICPNIHQCGAPACSSSTATIASPACCCSPGCGAVYFPEVVYPTPVNTANTILYRSCCCG